MQSLLLTYYLPLKVIHIVFIVAWYAGLFYIFRLFVYHAQQKHKADVCAVLSTMEAKLLKFIMLPASLLVVASGMLLLFAIPSYFKDLWLYAKISGVLGLFIYQGLAFYVHRSFSRSRFILSETQCRWINEFPTLILILIVTMVVIKPWQS